MSESEYFKCACKECGNNVEFPAAAAGTTITCPHCGQWTELPLAEKESEETGLRVGLVTLVVIAALLITTIGVGIWFWQHKGVVAENKPGSTPPAKAAVAPIVKVTSPPASISNQVTAQPVVHVTPKPSRPKSADDLKVGAVKLEKTKGSSLVYAVGIVKNDSDYDRYGVRIELDLISAKGKKLGTAKDYKDYLGPNQEWEFRALIPEPKTAEAQLSSVKEDQ